MKVVAYELLFFTKNFMVLYLFLSRSAGRDLITLTLHRNFEVYSTFIGSLGKDD